MTTRPAIGYTGQTITRPDGMVIRAWVKHVAYARNGNTHRPTVTKEWHVQTPAGRTVVRCGRLSEAKTAYLGAFGWFAK